MGIEGMGGTGNSGRVKGNDMGVTSIRAVGVPDNGNGRIKYTGLLDADRGGVPVEAADPRRCGVVGSSAGQMTAAYGGGGGGGVGGVGTGTRDISFAVAEVGADSTLGPLGPGIDARLPKSMATSNSVCESTAPESSCRRRLALPSHVGRGSTARRTRAGAYDACSTAARRSRKCAFSASRVVTRILRLSSSRANTLAVYTWYPSAFSSCIVRMRRARSTSAPPLVAVAAVVVVVVAVVPLEPRISSECTPSHSMVTLYFAASTYFVRGGLGRFGAVWCRVSERSNFSGIYREKSSCMYK